eukprot:7647044-Pyramimonas_sp.AAC.1
MKSLAVPVATRLPIPLGLVVGVLPMVVFDFSVTPASALALVLALVGRPRLGRRRLRWRGQGRSSCPQCLAGM